MKFTYYSNVKDGRLQKNVSELIAKELHTFEGKRIELTIQKLKSARSGQQNRYLHLLFTIFKNELNLLGNEFSMDEIKELCKAKFCLIDVVNESSGEVLGKRIKGTSEMTKSEMTDFIESIIRWGAEFNISLPYPNEEIMLKFDK